MTKDDSTKILAARQEKADKEAADKKAAEEAAAAAEAAEQQRLADEAAAAAAAEAQRVADEHAAAAAAEAQRVADEQARQQYVAPPAPAYVYYANCKAVQAAGAAPLYAGQPGYETPRLDRDGDGVACAGD
ncbi:excalibur calcium-binding domain-containing protein [Arthrobacter sp. zg-Y20]|uniref:excalibur calcium-binding domain-containing protein n=1 Tax=unclassified Arthrobacter TaxID=235627 RepID=UPI001D13937C|nr:MULTISPECIES: excalibur calcium-binding domain-containing protein [unclassified Arthrobacter]MCC3276544.1 excalibur calcium-binding domain-containing protein [Arthrobacter sp. zg-Y20]MDK1316704.1 excalibur calcium-binding domain-containing protein [Arthrobacter sp. zg.Y20]WIB06873.1 excalibur calcium-binding domain-containing protein [Arthrobacter sp. zg-Y20]